VKASAIVIGGVLNIVPIAAGVTTFLDPVLRRPVPPAGAASATGGPGPGFVLVARVNQLPEDGTPISFPVIADRQDAWNFYPNQRVGAVFLQRLPNNQVRALNVVCPHAGCFVDFNTERRNFICPCHNSFFQPTGERLDPETCPAPRDLDSLEVHPERLAANGEIWVKFMNFMAGTHEKTPIV